MPTIGWDETSPADADGANTGASALRSLKTNISGGLGTALYWPGTAGGSAASAGWPKVGTARPFYGTESQVSAYADGFLMLTSNTTRLFAVNSGSTPFLGSSRVIEGLAVPTSNTRSVLTGGSGLLNSSTITYGVTYTVPPFVMVTQVANNNNSAVLTPPGPSTTTFRVDVYSTSGGTYAASTITINWMALGTVAF